MPRIFLGSRSKTMAVPIIEVRLPNGGEKMPYKHSGEIGDVWKHLPLCDILKIEAPKRYFETNSAFAEYALTKNSFNKYGIYHLVENAPEAIKGSEFYRLLSEIGFMKTNTYYGSPALAMTVLEHKNTRFYFHDIEKEPLSDIQRFASKNRIMERVFVSRGDSISAFLHGDYCFDAYDFVFIDPYQPFDCNESGETFFDVFEKAIKSRAKTMLWYGYDTLKGQKSIIDKLNALSAVIPNVSLNTFDVWQECMEQDACAINPGVPGCGIACVNLQRESIQSITKYLSIIEDVFRDVEFNGEKTSLCIKYEV